MNESSEQYGNEPQEASPPKGRVDWAAWLRENGPRLLLFARRQARREADAEDILQEALVRLVRVVESGEFAGGREKWASYVFTSIVHLAMDYGRREDSRLARQGAVCRDSETEEQQPWFACASDRDYLGERVEALLKELPGRFSEVVILKIWGGQTFREISEMLGVSLNTVASRYRYALKAMHDSLSSSPII